MRTEREKAAFRAIMQEESRNLRENMQNTSNLIGDQYPRMLYRATEIADEEVLAEGRNGRPPEMTVRNRFGGLLCDTIVANDADEAETLAADGWDLSPQAAHGQVEGLVAATTAKDDEIAALRAELEAMRSTQGEPERRGPGRPRREVIEAGV